VKKISKADELLQTKKPLRSMCTCDKPSHLTTLVNRFLRTLENVKSWNGLDSLKGEAELRRHLANMIEYTFYFHKRRITEKEVEQLVWRLESMERC